MTVTTSTTRAQSLIDVETRYGSHNYHPLDVVCERLSVSPAQPTAGPAVMKGLR